MGADANERPVAVDQENQHHNPPTAPKKPGATFTADHTRLAEYLHRISRGDHDAFTAFYHQTARQVYGLTRRIIVDTEMAKEATQDIYLIVWQEAHRYNQALGTPTAWLMTIAHRRTVDKVRAEQSSTNRAAHWATYNHTPDYDTVAETVATKIEAQTVSTCLKSLSHLQREAINLAYYQCMTYRQVSEHLSIPLSTIKTRIRDGLKSLRTCLEGHQPE
ncbi:ECF RNA polymerase sigma factor SigK [Arthrobacter sp. TB 23]|uniref:ECF RNA polymerase sigma factor SigK n=1 Tax=Arthrobacter sp. TB 23 TaxID=494419 RepID=UPI0003648529|nr:ECF RNA polymerase sigma factor SigK [Arthrobacter sp. TB 23]